MAVKPILFNTRMVKAIVDGNKIETRRIMKPANKRKAKLEDYHQNAGLWIDINTHNSDNCAHIKDYSISPMWWLLPVYMNKYTPYKIGDILYVREKFCIGTISASINKDGEKFLYVRQNKDDKDYIPYEYCVRNNINIDNVIWKPSLHMPKDEARIFLKVVDVKVNKLLNISMEDAKNEGCFGTRILCTQKDCEKHDNCWSESPIDEFKRIWNDTLDKKEENRYGWDANPWVWIFSFEVFDIIQK